MKFERGSEPRIVLCFQGPWWKEGGHDVGV